MSCVAPLTFSINTAFRRNGKQFKQFGRQLNNRRLKTILYTNDPKVFSKMSSSIPFSQPYEFVRSSQLAEQLYCTRSRVSTRCEIMFNKSLQCLILNKISFQRRTIYFSAAPSQNSLFNARALRLAAKSAIMIYSYKLFIRASE